MPIQSHALAPGTVTFFDGLRFLLASIVVIGHGFGYFFGYWGGFFPSRFPYLQSIAVVGFFFVSGFLISNSVISKLSYGSINLMSYLIDRFSRIYSTLIPCLLFVLLVDSTFLRIFPGYDFAGSLTPEVFGNNALLIPGLPLGSMRPIWSLMFEWWMYILFGGLVLFAKNKVVSTFAIALGVYYTFFVNGKGEGGQLGIIWACGAISAIYYHRVSQTAFNKLLASAFFFAAATAVYADTLNPYNLYAGALLCVGLLMLSVHAGYGSAGANNKAVLYRYLAGYSYTLFLTHYTVLYWIQKAGISGVRGFVLSFFLANLVALMIARYTERHHKAVSRILNKITSKWQDN